MVNDVYRTVRCCGKCVRNKASEKRRRALKLFPESAPLEFVTRDILGPLPKTSKGNQFVWVMTDCYSKLERAVLTSTKTAVHAASMFMDHWIIPYGIPDYVLADNETQFIGNFFEWLRAS